MQNKWHRCSPVALIYFLLTQLKILINFWPALAALAFSNSLRNLFEPWMLAGLFLAIATTTCLSYWFFRFRFTDDRIEIRSGVLHRSKTLLNFDRVQEINLHQSIYFRAFRLWTLGLESAGSKTQEITIPGIPETLANTIRSLFLTSRTNNQTNETANEVDSAPATAADSDKAFLTMRFPDLVRIGLIHNTLIYFAAVASPLLSQSDSLRRAVANWVESSFLGVFVKNFAHENNIVAVVLLFAGLFLLGIALIYVVSIILAVVRFWNYSLYTKQDRYQYNTGLLSRVSKGFKLKKLQTIHVKQNMIARLLGRYSMVLSQTNPPANGENRNASGFLIPALTPAHTQQLKSELNIEETPWQHTMRIRVLGASLVWGSIIAAPSFFALKALDFFPYLALFSYALVSAIQYRFWKNDRFYLSGNWLAIRQGFIGHSIIYVPLIKIQKLELQEGPYLRLFGAARLRVHTGSRALTINFVAKAVLQDIKDHALNRVSAHRGAWM